MEYLKNILLKLYETGEAESLLPVLATILKLRYGPVEVSLDWSNRVLPPDLGPLEGAAGSQGTLRAGAGTAWVAGKGGVNVPVGVGAGCEERASTASPDV